MYNYCINTSGKENDWKHKERTGCIEVLKYSIKEEALETEKSDYSVADCSLSAWFAGIDSYKSVHVKYSRQYILDDDSVKDLEAEYIVVLGAKVYKDGRLSLILDDRVKAAVKL